MKNLPAEAFDLLDDLSAAFRNVMATRPPMPEADRANRLDLIARARNICDERAQTTHAPDMLEAVESIISTYDEYGTKTPIYGELLALHDRTMEALKGCNHWPGQR